MEAEQPLEDLIVIHPHLLQKFMRQGKNFANLLALYTFYTYQAKLQKTNQPLSTDEFTRRGMNWAIDRVKKTKKLLKSMGLISVVQKGYYSYIQLPFIYTKKKIGELLGKVLMSQKSVESMETECLHPKKSETKNDEARLKPSVPSVPMVFKQWVEYCDKNAIRYNKNSLNSWQEKLKNRTTIEQKEAIYIAIGKKWKNFYMTPIKESKYHKLLGKNLMMERDCDILLDIDKRDGRFYYQFKNVQISSEIEPFKLFGRYGYSKEKPKTNPIVSEVKKRILDVVRRF